MGNIPKYKDNCSHLCCICYLMLLPIRPGCKNIKIYIYKRPWAAYVKLGTTISINLKAGNEEQCWDRRESLNCHD